MLRVVYGLPMDGRGERLLEEARQTSGDPGYLHLVRTQPREEQLRSVESAKSGSRLGTSVARLPELVRLLARRRSHLRAELSDARRALILDNLARHEAQPPLRSVPGLAEWLGRLFSRLKQGDVFSPDHAFARLRSLDRDDPGTREALRLFGLYQARLVDLGLYDEDGLFLEVARDLGTDELPFARLQPVRRRLVVEGFYQTNVVERAIFEKLFEAFEETSWLVDMPDQTRPAKAGGPETGFGLSVFEGDLSWLPSGLSCTQAVERTTSEEPSLDWIWTPEIAARTELVEAPDERTEARFLVERAAALQRDDPLASVVIAFSSDRAAAGLLQESCADLGLPLAVVAAPQALASLPPVRALLSLLDLAARDFPRDLVVAALRGASTPTRAAHALGTPAGAEVSIGGVRLAAPRVDRVARRAGIVSGAAAWLRKLERFARAREDESASVTDEAERARLARSAAEAAEVRTGIAALIDLLPNPAVPLGVAAFAAKVGDLLERFGFLREDRVADAAPAAEEIAALAAAARTRSALVAALDDFASAAPVLGAPERSWSDHAAAFAAHLAATAVPLPAARSAGVRLVGLRELRGLVTDHLLVGGLNDGSLPGAAEPIPLLDESDAALLGARTTEARRREAEHLLVQALRSPRRSLVLSRPLTVDGCEALPALALEAIRACAGLRPQTDAGRELRDGPVMGRGSRARQAAAALVEEEIPKGKAAGGLAARRLQALIGAGADPALAWHRLGAERERHDPGSLGRFEGMLEAAALPLLDDGASEIQVSASRLEAYVKCPMQAFFQRELRLSVPQDADLEVSALDKGSVIHAILDAFHRKVAAGGVRPEDEARVLEAIARERLARLPHEGLFAETFRDALTRGLISDVASKRRGILRAYLDYEDQRKEGFRPAFFEARFGPPPRGVPPESVLSPDPIPLFDVKVGARTVHVTLKGSIDRVDLLDEGGVTRAVVLDYKSGTVDRKSWEAKVGLAFQLPLYSHVLPKLLAKALGGVEVRTVAAAYYQVASASEVGFKAVLADQADLKRLSSRLRRALPDGGFEKLVADYVSRARAVVESRLAGRFHPTAIFAKDSPCTFCDFGDVCRGRGESARIAHMPADARFPQIVDLLGRDPDEEDES